MPSDSTTGSTVRPTTLKRVIVAATIGNVLEWFDFVVYGFLAVTLSEEREISSYERDRERTGPVTTAL